MKHLILRSLREIRSTKAQFISIIIIIAIGSAIFTGLFSTVHLIESWLSMSLRLMSQKSMNSVFRTRY